MKVILGFFALFAISGPSCLKLGNVQTKPITKQHFQFEAGKVFLIENSFKAVAQQAAEALSEKVTFNRIAHRKGHPVAIYFRSGLKTKVLHEYNYLAPDVLQRIINAKTEEEFKKELTFPCALSKSLLIANLWTRVDGNIVPVKIRASAGIKTLVNIGIVTDSEVDKKDDGVNFWSISVGKAISKSEAKR